MADANRGWIGALPPWIQRHEASPSPPFQQPASICSLAQAAFPMSVHPIPTEYASPAPIGAPQDDSEGAEDVAADLELLASQSGNLRRIKLIMPQYSQPTQDNFATPAARLKNRPKRAVTQASNPVPPVLTDDDDLADEDYVVPRSVSTSLGMKKQREKMRVNPLAPASASPRPTHNHHFPSNAYLSLGALTVLLPLYYHIYSILPTDHSEAPYEASSNHIKNLSKLCSPSSILCLAFSSQSGPAQ